MTIYLPEEPTLLRQALDATCDRIIASDSDASFTHCSCSLSQVFARIPY